MKRTALFFLAAIVASPLSAQIEEDPRERMQEILDQIAEEMKQIDDWLQQSSRSKEAAKSMGANIEKLNKLLDSVGKSQESVVKGIDDLLKEAEKLKSQSQSQSSSQDKKQQRGQSQQNQSERERQEQARQRRRLQPQNRPQDQQDKKDQGQERNDRPEKEKGENVASQKRPDGATEKVDAKKVQGAWGELPDYLLKHGRGSMPSVPEKYRRYLEALTRQGDKKQ